MPLCIFYVSVMLMCIFYVSVHVWTGWQAGAGRAGGQAEWRSERASFPSLVRSDCTRGRCARRAARQLAPPPLPDARRSSLRRFLSPASSSHGSFRRHLADTPHSTRCTTPGGAGLKCGGRTPGGEPGGDGGRRLGIGAAGTAGGGGGGGTRGGAGTNGGGGGTSTRSATGGGGGGNTAGVRAGMGGAGGRMGGSTAWMPAGTTAFAVAFGGG